MGRGRGWGGRRYYGQDEGSATEKPQTKILPSLSPRGDKFRQELLTKIIPWEEITVYLDNFPYYIQENSKSLLVECVASNLKHNKLRKYCADLKSTRGRIRLQTIPGAELYRERLVSAVAREMKVPLLRLDKDHGCDKEKEKEKDRRKYHVHYHSNMQSAYDQSDQSDSAEENYNKEVAFKKGDRVKYVGMKFSFKEVNNRTLSHNQRGEVYEVKGNTVAVVFNISGLIKNEAEKEEKNTEILRQALVVWLHVNDVEQDLEVRKHDCYIAMEVLYEVLESQQPVIVYFSDSFLWPSPLFSYDELFWKNIFNQFPEGVVMICAENNSGAGFKNREEMPKPLKQYIERLQRDFPESDGNMDKIFMNVVCIKPPKDEDLANTFVEQIEQDRSTVISEGNLVTMNKVLKDHNLSCMNLEHANVKDIILTREKVEKIVGWALNHYSSLCPVPCVNEEKLHISHDSLKLMISRLKEEEDFISRLKKKPEEQSNRFQNFGSEYFDENLVSATFGPEDLYMKFDDFCAPENLKKLLYQTVILPMRRPELFSHDQNLFKPCKGILLYGPPGSGKTHIVKALAKESGANLINITVEIFTHMPWRLPAYVNKLAPVIIFLDEVVLGARGCNGFMKYWDGLASQDRQRILVVGATNRPFDLDEAVIRRMPRRIYVGLPDLENRSKILNLILNKENLESGFSFEHLAEATEGYSWSDLKNLCIVAAYRPIEVFAEQESKGEASGGVPALRALNLMDFINSKAKVRPSVADDATDMMREWHEQYGDGERQ